MSPSTKIPDQTSAPASWFLLFAALLLSFSAVFLAGSAGVFRPIAEASAPGYGLVIGAVTMGTIALSFLVSGVRRTLDTVSLRALTLFHTPRLIGGLAFLAYGWTGALPPVFAALVGFGDIIAALVAMTILPMSAPSRLWLVAIHAIGLADLATGLVSGMTHGLIGDARLVPLAELPLSLIVLWWVPLLAATHVHALVRLARR